MSEKYSRGDIVKITFTAVVTDEDGLTSGRSLKPDNYLLVQDQGMAFNHAIFKESIGDGITVEMVKKANPDPENWPAKEGDVWRTSSRIYHFVGGAFRYSSYGAVETISPSSLKGRAGLRLVHRSNF